MGKWTSEFKRGKIHAYREGGKTVRVIASLLKMPPSTVSDCLARKTEHEPKATAPKIGRPRSLTPRDARRVVKAVQQDGAITYGEVKDDLGFTCTPRTICRAANNAGIFNLKPPGKGKLTADHMAARLEYSKKHDKKPHAFWKSSIHFYMDGTIFRKMRDIPAARRGLGNRRKRRKGEGLANKNLPEHPNQASTHKVPFFVGLSGQGQITLAEPYDLPMKMKSDKWVPIRAKIPAAVQAAHPNLNPPNWLISQDNDHTQNSHPAWWSQRNITFHKGPPNSGDLRGIESIWPVLNRRIAETDPGPKETKLQFTTRVRDLLVGFDPGLLTKKLTNMQNRLTSCIRNKGGRVPY